MHLKLGEDTENDVFRLKLHKHGKSMVSAQQAALSSRNGPKGFQMVMPFVSNDDNADDDSRCSSQAWVLSVNVSQ